MDAQFFASVALWSQVAGAGAFLVTLVLLFRKYVIPAVAANEQARNAEIAGAESRRAALQAELAKARAELERADHDAAEIRNRLMEQVARTRAQLQAEAQADGERLVHNAEGELERARLAARDRLRIEFIQRALAKARHDAAGRVSDATNERLVARTVDDLVRGSA
jgi:F0F1-type ATP synthase membrane subunit b/b'